MFTTLGLMPKRDVSLQSWGKSRVTFRTVLEVPTERCFRLRLNRKRRTPLIALEESMGFLSPQ